MKRLAVSYWSVTLVGAVLFGLHAWWWSARPAQRGEIVSGFGATLIVVGLWVAARPYIRAGVQGIAEAQIQAPQFLPDLDEEGRIIAQTQAAYRQKVEAAKPDVRAERVIAVVVIVIGTGFNGYGAPLVRVFGF